MTPTGRALVGALVGAVITLMIHPVSRPFLLQPLLRVPSSQVLSCLPDEAGKLPEPTDLATAALYMQEAAVRISQRQSLTPNETKSLLALNAVAAQREPDNAFWPQTRAVLLNLEGDRNGAWRSWQQGSKCIKWNDYQSDRLQAAQKRIAALVGSNHAWTMGTAYFHRSDVAAILIEKFAEALLARTSIESFDGLEKRIVSVRNGALIRSGGRSFRVAEHGANIVELSTYPANMSRPEGFKRLWIAQTHLTSTIRQNRSAEIARTVERDFRDNEGWRYYARIAEPEQDVRDLCVASILASGLPGAMLVGSLLGALLYSVGWIFRVQFESARLFHPAAILFASVVTVGGLFGLTASWPAALASALCVSFISMGPFNPRRRKTNDLGPLFTFTLLCIWLIFTISLISFLASNSVAARVLVPNLGTDGELLADPRTFIGTGAITMSLLGLVGPAWAVVHRYGTPDLVGLAFCRLGRIAIYGGLWLAILLGPASIYVDRYCNDRLTALVGNEPIYYQSQ